MAGLQVLIIQFFIQYVQLWVELYSNSADKTFKHLLLVWQIWCFLFFHPNNTT